MPSSRSEIFGFSIDYVAYASKGGKSADDTQISTSAESNGNPKIIKNWLLSEEIKFLECYGYESFRDMRKNEHKLQFTSLLGKQT